MALPQHDDSRFESERRSLIALMEQIDAEAGVPLEPNMTVDELHASEIAHGIRPEENGASRELLRVRYGDVHEN
jgi:hypothetical protein